MSHELRRQGDFLLVRLPEDVQVQADNIVGTNVISRSTLTGHAHQFASKKTKIRSIKGSADQIATIPSATKLVHEEHSAIPIAKGREYIRRQVERSSDGIRVVQD